jgi:hypothetical protein
LHSDFFQGQMDRSIFYWPNHSGELSCSNKKKEKKMMKTSGFSFAALLSLPREAKASLCTVKDNPYPM